MSAKEMKMNKLLDELVNFKESPLYSERIENDVLPVLGEGNCDADIMFVGEAPGKNEAKTGKPFCGASGKILDGLLEHIGLDRKQVYVTNIVKDRPTDNRDPKPEEIELYAPFLDTQISIVKPCVLAPLGRFSAEYIMRRYGLESHIDTISTIHGQVFETTIDGQLVHIVPLYHPAVGIYTRKKLPELQTDFEILKRFL